ncbi:hypothetical protein VPNG_04603 [Cytospora leucostoma]|uniref:Arrestin-like N-terminal domain-containing protein n=1 Tax=Cytospora leucostoma TaxID=1230097 RepID=A0A423XCB5_9PEZI|nr:hypothetical protein VPNG_04603 [Cytospora leucostoma]
MPPSQHKVGPELDIQLDNIGRPYKPGDVITGRVLRRAQTVSPRATVTIQLLGRAKTKIVVTRHTGQSTTQSYYRSRFNFFEDAQTRRQLHDGPIHVTSGGSPEIWEFAINVPLTPSPLAIRAHNPKPESSFLSLIANDIASYPLPSSFATEGRKLHTRFEGYVEYHLEASLLQQGSHHEKAITATLPIQLRTPSMPYPLVNFDLQQHAWPCTVSAYRLVPGMENAELSFKQKSQQFFRSSKVPKFAFTVWTSCPGVIQLGNPTPIPFLVRIVPDKKRTSEVLHDVPETARVNALDFVIKADTTVIAPGTFTTHDGKDSIHYNINIPVTSRGLQVAPQGTDDAYTTQRRGEDDETQASPGVDEKATKGMSKSEDAQASPSAGHPIPRPSSEQLPAYQAATQQPYTAQLGPLLVPARWETDEKPVDLGAAVGFRIFPTRAVAFGRSIPGTHASDEPISPDFTTYCIRHSHRLKWKLVIGVAGETVKIEGTQPITVMGASQM